MTWNLLWFFPKNVFFLLPKNNVKILVIIDPFIFYLDTSAKKVFEKSSHEFEFTERHSEQVWAWAQLALNEKRYLTYGIVSKLAFTAKKVWALSKHYAPKEYLHIHSCNLILCKASKNIWTPESNLSQFKPKLNSIAILFGKTLRFEYNNLSFKLTLLKLTLIYLRLITGKWSKENFNLFSQNFHSF